MEKEKEIPKTYYEKILVSSGEVPESEGWQDTNRGPVQWANGIWQLSRNNIIPVTYFYKQASVPSPKQEADIIKLLRMKLENEISLNNGDYFLVDLNKVFSLDLSVSSNK